LKDIEFIKMVKEDILRIEEALNTNSGIMDLLYELVGKYSKVSNNFPAIEMNPLLFKMHSYIPKQYLREIQGFLKAYELNDCEDYNFDKLKSNEINITTNISNRLEICTFSEVKNDIENMTSLPDTEIEDILSKIEELEGIINSTDRKSKKWENAKCIIKWIADKGVDVGLTLLPLLLKIQ